MLRRCFIACLLLLLGLVPRAWAGSAAPPQRIVSLKPTITDVVVALGAGDRLVGVTKYCSVPPSPTPLPSGERERVRGGPTIIGDYTQPSLERIVALAPDLVLGSQENSSRRSVEQLERMGIAVALFPFTTVPEILDSIRGIGTALGVPDKGRALAAKMERGLAELKKSWGADRPQRLLVVWGVRPLIVAGPGTYLDELLGYIGATNAVTQGRTRLRYPRLGLEEIVALDPDVIVDLSMGSESEHAGRRPWDGVTALSAVRTGRAFALDPNLFRAGPRLPEALEALARVVHGSNNSRRTLVH